MSLFLMAIKPSAHTSFDGEISLLDTIQFFKANIKRISFFVVLYILMIYIVSNLCEPIIPQIKHIKIPKIITLLVYWV